MSTAARETERFTALAAQHKRADWSDRTYACAGCRLRAEDAPVPPDETPEQMRERWKKHQEILYPGWSFHDYNAHVAEHFIAAGWVSPEKHRAEIDRIMVASHRYAADREDLQQEVMVLEEQVQRVEVVRTKWREHVAGLNPWQWCKQMLNDLDAALTPVTPASEHAAPGGES